jgi:subfamily B ATP-binding cassette protein MsbA
MTAFLRRIWALARPYKFRLICGLLCGIGFALSNVLLMVVLKIVPNIIFAAPGADVLGDLPDKLQKFVQKLPHFLQALVPDALLHLHLQGPQSKTVVILAICALPAVMLLRSLFSYLNIYLTSWAATRAIADLRLKLFDHLQNLSLDFFDTARTGNLITRLLSDTASVHVTIANSLGTMVRDPVTILFLLILLLTQQPGLTLITLLVLPLCAGFVIIYGRKVRTSSKAIQTNIAELGDVMHEAFTGNRVVKAYNLEAVVLKRFRAALSSFVSHFMRIVRGQELPGPLIEFLGSLGVALVFTYIAFLCKPVSKPTVGDFVQFLASVFMLYGPIKALGRLQTQLEQARAASERVFGYLDTPSSIVDPPNPVALNAAGADIHFEDIDFDYGGEKPVLRNINLTVKAGQMVALVGKTGSGKTTLTNLLLRFYDPKKGSVLIGSTDIRQVSLKDLRRQIALVAQDTILFNDTIRNNIALGRPGATNAEIEAAARHANAEEFILQKERGYDTVVGEKGTLVSGGQRQRLAIARALVRNAPILVLDEATSALDTDTERQVQAAFDELMHGRTTICIAHRLSTVQKADLIVVLDQGRIVESGTHAQLIQQRGIYSGLYELQFRTAEV